jgi:hypothetical protein
VFADPYPPKWADRRLMAKGIEGARAAVGRVDGCVGLFPGRPPTPTPPTPTPFARSAGPQERALWLFHRLGKLGREKSRCGAARGAYGGGPGLLWSVASFGLVPRRPEPTHLDSAPSRPHPLLGPSAHLLGAWMAN